MFTRDNSLRLPKTRPGWLKIFLLSALLLGAVGVSAVKAQTPTNLGGLDTTRTQIGYRERDIFVIGSSAARTALSFLGVIFAALIIVAGFMWMTSRGNKANALTARKMMTYAVIGLIVIVSAYAVAAWVADTFSPPVMNQNSNTIP